MDSSTLPPGEQPVQLLPGIPSGLAPLASFGLFAGVTEQKVGSPFMEHLLLPLPRDACGANLDFFICLLSATLLVY